MVVLRGGGGRVCFDGQGRLEVGKESEERERWVVRISPSKERRSSLDLPLLLQVLGLPIIKDPRPPPNNHHHHLRLPRANKRELRRNHLEMKDKKPAELTSNIFAVFLLINGTI